MPIYEFYCQPCHTVYNFFARSTTNTKKPKCPKCGNKRLDKQVSRFAISKGLSESTQNETEDPFANMDESKMESVMAEMASVMGDEEGGGEEDPRKMATAMKKFFEATGMKPNASMLEAMVRMEAGEDPDKIDEDLGEAIDIDESGASGVNKLTEKIRRMLDRPKVDPELYDL
jgi:putative FmdB family regulatory protein